MEMRVKALPWRQSPWGRGCFPERERHRRVFWRPLATTRRAVGGALVSAPRPHLSRPFPSLQRERLKNIERICSLLRKVSVRTGVRELLASAAFTLCSPVRPFPSLSLFDPLCRLGGWEWQAREAF